MADSRPNVAGVTGWIAAQGKLQSLSMSFIINCTLSLMFSILLCKMPLFNNGMAFVINLHLFLVVIIVRGGFHIAPTTALQHCCNNRGVRAQVYLVC